MAIFRFSFLKRLIPRSSHSTASQSPAQGQSVKPQVTPVSPGPKTLAQIEQELEAEAQAKRIQTPSVRRNSTANWRRYFNRLMWLALLVGIPCGALWFVNLPYPVIRRPIADDAPILLLPSYMRIDRNYRKAISLVEQATQLIDRATSFADIELGDEKVQQAQASLDRIPTGFLNDYPEYRYWWYDWRFSPIRFNNARAKVGELEAKVFQERNAHDALIQAEQTLVAARQRYQQATTPADKQAAVSAWQMAIANLIQIPSQTFAGKTAQQKVATYQAEFQATVGLAADQDQTSALIRAARNFGWQAAKAAQYPPHSVAEWQQVENLWNEAILRLERVPTDNVVGYTTAQTLLAEYRANLEQIKVRARVEADSVNAFQQAQRGIEQLQATADRLTPNQTWGRLQTIVNQLNAVSPGTTVYPEAQELLVFANQKLDQLAPQ
jgi:hypothetical protein